MFRNWMNSLGVRPHVNYLYSDLCNGLVIFQLMDYIRPGIVDWEKRVIRQEKMSGMMSKRFQEILSNCNYAVELARYLNLVFVGIAGSDIHMLVDTSALLCHKVTAQGTHSPLLGAFPAFRRGLHGKDLLWAKMFPPIHSFCACQTIMVSLCESRTSSSTLFSDIFY